MRKCCISFLLASCILLSSCSTVKEPSDTNNSDTMVQSVSCFESQNKYRGVASSAISFQEAEDYFLGSGFSGQFIYYYDKVSRNSGVLCADPSCTHDSSACGAYANYGSFFYSGDGKCYWIGVDAQGDGRDFYLWNGELSGKNRKKVKRLSYDDVIIEYNPQQYEIHRGRLYILGKKDIVDGVNTYERVMLLSAPLDSSEELTVLFDETFDRNVHPSVRFVGNDVYLTMQIFPTGGPFDVTILKFDAESGEVERVYEETGMAEWIDPAWVTEEGDIYLPGADENHAYVWKLQDGELVEIASWAGTEASNPCIMDGIAVYLSRKDGVREVEIINLTGERLYSGKLFPENIPGLEDDPNTYSFAVIGGDTDKLILNLQKFTGNGLTDYTVMLDLNDNMKPAVLWSSQR